MNMNRRNLLKLSTLVGAAATLPWLSSGSAQSSYSGPYWIFVTASGGWDPRFLFDPTLNAEQNRLYTEIGSVGNIRFAPLDATPDEFNLELAEGEALPYLNAERFLNAHGSRLLVLNGVDTSTNNHDSGQRAVTCGSLSEGSPAMGALLAATYGLDKPLPFVSFGGYDATLDLAPLSRIGSSNVLRDLASPNVIAPEREAADYEYYHTEDTWERIRSLQTEGLDELMSEQRLPRVARSQNALMRARATVNELATLRVPELVDLPGNLTSAENFIRSGQLALAAFASGLAVAANISMGGFDTHGNHDQNQRRNLIQLLTGLGGLIDQIEGTGLTDQVYVVVGSDFGRTPWYNADGDGGGKDHWPVTSYLALGPTIEGNRVIGATTEDQLAMPIDPSSLQAGSGGTKLTPAHIHLALRQAANIEPSLLTRYPLLGETLPLFG